VPVFFFRYEDMILDPKTTLEKIFSFVLSEKHLDGKLISKRIADVLSKGPEASISYKP
jgi:hypothetical protein